MIYFQFNTLVYVYIITIILLIVFCVYLLYESTDINQHNRTIEKDGYVVFEHTNKENVLNRLPKGYEFLDYRYEIKGCTLSTFHRDVTSSQYIFKTKHPVYTYIVYNNNGPLLSVCPNSHKMTPFLFSKPCIIHGKENTAILFNCDIVHAGAMNNFGNKRNLIQYKICHDDDRHILENLNKIHYIHTEKCRNTKGYEYVCRKISLCFSFIINHVFVKLLQEKPEKDSAFDQILNILHIGKFYNK